MRNAAQVTARLDTEVVVLDVHHGARARLGASGLAHLVIADHTAAPPVGRVVAWRDQLAARGVVSVRTGALAARPADAFAAAGFRVVQTLALLSADPCERRHLEGRRRDSLTRPRSVRSATELPMVASIDRAAFGEQWALDEAGVLDACRATGSHRLRVIDDCAYAVTGRSQQAGFLQRLAVLPSAQRSGLGRCLVVDSLEWLRRWRVHTAMVNTHVENHAALGLYESLGFERLGDELVVMEAP